MFEGPTPPLGGNEGVDIAAVLDAHLAAEFQDHDLDATMATMADDPMLFHVPTCAGGVGTEEVRAFYRDRFLPCWPDDTAVTTLTRTVGADHVIDEVVVSFTHTCEMPALLPGVAPTGRKVALAHAVVAGFRDGKVAYERIYWDQGSLLEQVGLIDGAGIPVWGATQARAVLDGRPTDPLA